MVGDIALIDTHLSARRRELPNPRLGAGCRRSSAADKGDRAGTVRCQPAGALIAEPIDTTGDQISAVAAQRDFRRFAQPHAVIITRHENELADVARRLHEPEGVVEFGKGDDPMCEWSDFPRGECG